MEKRKIQGSSYTSLTEIALYILCSLIFCGCLWTFESARSVFLFLIFFNCSVVQFIILFKKSLKLHDKILFPFIFLLPLPLILDPNARPPFGFLGGISLFVAILRWFPILDFLGLCMLLRPEKEQEKSSFKHKKKKEIWLRDILWRIPLLLILVILFFSEFKCGDLGCLVIATGKFALIIFFYFIFPTKSIVSLIQSVCRSKSSKQVLKCHTRTKQRFPKNR